MVDLDAVRTQETGLVTYTRDSGFVSVKWALETLGALLYDRSSPFLRLVFFSTLKAENNAS